MIAWENSSGAHQLRLPAKDSVIQPWPALSILIPLRNEAEQVLELINNLKTLDYPKLEIWLYDDQSTDITRSLLEEAVRNHAGFHMLVGHALPSGWLGKNFACSELALKAKGDYLLFMDADVRISSDALYATLHTMRTERLSLLSVFPKQITLGVAERLMVPLINHLLLSWLPLHLIRASKFPTIAAANGQYMCFLAADYRQHLWHTQLRNQLVEDMAIARAMKAEKLAMLCKLSRSGLVNCRMYRKPEAVVHGMAKSVVAGFGGQPLWLGMYMFVTTGLWLCLFWYSPLYALILLPFTLLCRIFVTRASGDSTSDGVLLLFLQQFSWCMLFFYALYQHQFKKLKWKDRFVLL
ncbi:MAG: glycosyltransferase [Bacteroidia bacterium]